MAEIYTGSIGLIHVISSCSALFFGSLILFTKKGTSRHRKMGYAYVFSMLVLLTTALMIYRLFNGWGIFHYFALLSLLTILLGMLPLWAKTSRSNAIYFHFIFMYWSVIGLYAAFASEVLTRIPKTPFFNMIGLATGIIMLLGGVYFKIKKKSWLATMNTRT